MFVLTSNITIGRFKSVKLAEVKVTKSMKDFVDRAVIKLPLTARVKQAGATSESTETAKLFSEGDKVIINLGYDGKLRNEFTGFVTRLNFTQPLEVECEGYSYQLRQNSYLKTFTKTTLKEMLRFLVADTDITLDAAIPELKIDKWVMDNQTGTEVLDKIKKELLVDIFFTNAVLYAGLLYLNPKADVKYRLGWNTIKDNELKLREAKNREVIVKYVGEKKDGTKTEVQHGHHKKTAVKVSGSSGSDGETLVLKSHTTTDQATLSAMAEKKHSLLTYDGYEGKITAFGVPYCEPGYRAIIDDKKYPERSGRYIVESTEVSYGRQGFRRKAGIGLKL